MKEKLVDFYKDWCEKWLTVERMAEWHGITEDQCNTLINMGREIYGEENDLLL